MPVLSSKSRDFLGSVGLGKGAGSQGQKFADDLAQEMGASHYPTAQVTRVDRIQGNGHALKTARQYP